MRDNFLKSKAVDSAVAAIQRGEFTDYANAARKYGCSRTAVSRRVRGLTKTKREANSFWHQCLTIEQEEVLIDRINYLTDRAMPPTSHIVRNLAEEIKGGPVGKNWVGQFVKRHGIRLKSLYLRNIDNLRAGAEYAPMFQLFFNVLATVIEKYRITAENIYNFDEKGFLMGFGRSLKRIMTRAALDSGRVSKSKQDGSREFISVLACISAIGKWIPPLLVYKGESGDLMSTWVDEVITDSMAHFTVSPNGWSNNAIGQMWLQKVFHRYTKPLRETQKRLLIVDGHSSHVNMTFVNWADEHGIILLILPPHTTHRLQPLDVGMFQPLSTNYSWELDQIMNESEGRVSMSKSFFWPMFKRSWDKAFTEKNIQSAFCKAGIWPTNGTQVLMTITRPTPPTPEKTSELRSPKSAKAIRRFHAAYDKDPTVEKVKKLFSTTLHLSAQVAVLRHENQGLFKAIELQKKKNHQGVRLNLCGKANKDIIDCYLPVQVVKAREYQAEKEALAVVEEQAKYQRKIQRAANALRKKEEQAEKQRLKAIKDTEKQLAKDLAAANKSVKKVPRKKPAAAAKTAKTTSLIVPIRQKLSPLPRPGARKPKSRVLVVPPEQVDSTGVAVAKTASRSINLPQRFR